MTRRSVRNRVMRALIAIAVGGSAFQLGGCDPAVRSTLLDGLQGTTQTLSEALITAFFLSLADGDTGTGTSTTSP